MKLSARQREVMELVITGLSNKEISTQMGITEQVVKNYLKVIYEKMGVESRVRLVLKYYAKPISDYRASVAGSS